MLIKALNPVPAILPLVVLTLASPAFPDDWNTGVGGNAPRDGLSGHVGPTAPEILWQGSRPAIVAQQAVIDGELMVVPRIASFTIPTGTWIVAHDLTTGDIQWEVQLPYDFPGSSWRSRVSAIRDGLVYATRAGNTNLDYLYALDPADGSIIWQSEDLIDEATTESLSFADDGDLIAGNFASVMRIDRQDGATVWSSTRSCPTTNGCQASVFGDHVYLWEASPTGPKVSVFDLATGDFLYSSDAIGGGFVQQVGLFIGPDGTVYAPRTQNNPVTDFFVAYEDTGSALVEKWRIPMGYTPFASFAVGPDGSVYTYDTEQDGGEADLFVLRVDPVSGDVVNISDAIRTNFPASPRIAVDADGKVFLTNGGFSLGALISFNADLTERWRETITNVNVGGPAIGPGGVLIVCGVGTDVRAYQTKPSDCPADLDGDGSVGFADLLAVLGAWGSCPASCPEDLDGDGSVGFSDLLAVLTAWGPCP